MPYTLLQGVMYTREGTSFDQDAAKFELHRPHNNSDDRFHWCRQSSLQAIFQWISSPGLHKQAIQTTSASIENSRQRKHLKRSFTTILVISTLHQKKAVKTPARHQGTYTCSRYCTTASLSCFKTNIAVSEAIAQSCEDSLQKTFLTLTSILLTGDPLSQS